MYKIKVMLLLAVAFVMTAGCAATTPHEVRHFYWPQLPERPRIEWLKSYRSQSDFPKSGAQKFMTDIAGEMEKVTLDKPTSISSDGAGKVYVVDSGRINGVVVFDLNKQQVDILGGDNSAAQFSFPTGVDLDDEGNVYVADVEKKEVMVFDASGKPLKKINTAGQVQRNTGIAVDRKGKRLLVSDSYGHQVAVYGLNGEHLFSFGKRGDADGEFNYPACVTVNHKGEIIIGDSMNARIQIFDGQGKFLRKMGARGDGPANFQILKGVAVDSDDNIYVTDGRAHKIVIFSTRGEYLLTIGGLHSVFNSGLEAPGGFQIPLGIFIDKNDVIYVADQMNKRFQVFQYISDSYLKAHPIAGFKE